MILPAQKLKRAAMLTCGLCGETRIVQATIMTKPEGFEVEIHPRDHDIAARFGRIHLEPRVLVVR